MEKRMAMALKRLLFILPVIFLLTGFEPAWAADKATSGKSVIGLAADLFQAAREENLERVDVLIEALGKVDPPLPENVAEATAYWLNLYNGLVTWQKLTHPRWLHTIKGRISFFSGPVIRLSGEEWSLDDMENGVLRANPPMGLLKRRKIPSGAAMKLRFVLKELDPRIHGALNCGAVSCPPIAFYEPERLDDQLDMAITNLIYQGRFEPKGNQLWVSKIFDWYGQDFSDPSILDWFNRFFEEPAYKKAIKLGKDIKIRFMEYHWE